MFPCASESTEMTAPQVMPAGSCGQPSATWYGFSCAYTAPAETSAAIRITTRMDFIDAPPLFLDGIGGDHTTYCGGGLRSVNEQLFRGKAHSPPREEGWLRHQENFGEAHLSAADGVVAHKSHSRVSDDLS